MARADEMRNKKSGTRPPDRFTLMPGLHQPGPDWCRLTRVHVPRAIERKAAGAGPAAGRGGRRSSPAMLGLTARFHRPTPPTGKAPEVAWWTAVPLFTGVPQFTAGRKRRFEVPSVLVATERDLNEVWLVIVEQHRPRCTTDHLGGAGLGDVWKRGGPPRGSTNVLAGVVKPEAGHRF